MSEKVTPKSPFPRVQIRGKLQSVDRFDGKSGPIFENLVVMPAPDEFTSPLRLVIKAGHQIAQIDTMVDVLADLRSRYWRNDKSGKVQYVPELWLAA